MGFEQFFRKFYTRRPNAPSGHHCRRPRKICPRKRPIHWTAITRKLLKSFKTSLQKLNTQTLKNYNTIIAYSEIQNFNHSWISSLWFLTFSRICFGRSFHCFGLKWIFQLSRTVYYILYILQINIRYFKNTVNVLNKFFISGKKRLSERRWNSVFKE